MIRRTARLRAWCMAVMAASAIGCQTPAVQESGEFDDERPSRVETRWTSTHEWFVEHPMLVAGEAAEFAVHVTAIDGFRAVESGGVDVALLDGTGASQQRVVADAVARPGIFLPVLTPERAGSARLVLTYRDPAGGEDQVEWDVNVASSIADLRLPPAEPDGIGFLKEQQWRMPFATVAVTTSQVQEAFVLPATITSHPGHTAAVTSPGPGIFRASEARLPGPGTQVRAGQVLGNLHPSPGLADDWSSLQSELVRARNDVVEAERGHERAERLLAAGAIPGRRLDEATTTLDSARARLRSVAARAEVLESMGFEMTGSATLPIVAPIAGVVTEVTVTSGEPVNSEHALFRIVNLDWLVARVEVPETALARLLAARSAGEPVEVLVRPGGARYGVGATDWIRAGRLLDFGTEVDTATRLAAVRHELQGVGDRFRPGMSAEAQVLVGGSRQALTVPAGAIIDLAGVPVLYVQLAGETFEERAVVTGVRNGDVVEVVSGVNPGDRVVTVGAYQVRLAALSPDAAPAHSH